MSLVQNTIPQSIIDYNGNNTNIPNAIQLSEYFTKIRGMLDFIRIFLIVNYTYIDNIPVKNMFKLLYVPLNTNTTEPPSQKRSKSLKPELKEPTYISINCEIDFNQMVDAASMGHPNSRIITFYKNVYFQLVSKLNDVFDVDSFYQNYGKKNMPIGEFSLENLNKTYSLYYFKDNVNFFIPTFGSINAKICYKYFDDETLQDVMQTIDESIYTCSVIELNKAFFVDLPKLNKKINIEYFNEDSIVSFIFNKSDDRFIELPNKPIEVEAIPDEPIDYYPNTPTFYGLSDDSDNNNSYQKSIFEKQIPFAIKPANVLYVTPNPNRGLVFADKPVLEEYRPERPERPERSLKRRTPYGGTTRKKKAKNGKTKKQQKVKRNTKLHFTQVTK